MTTLARPTLVCMAVLLFGIGLERCGADDAISTELQSLLAWKTRILADHDPRSSYDKFIGRDPKSSVMAVVNISVAIEGKTKSAAPSGAPLMMFVTGYDPIWKKEVTKDKSDLWISRMKSLAKEDVAAWHVKLKGVEGNSFPEIQTIGRIADVDRLFNDKGVVAEQSTLLQKRIDTVPKVRIQELADAFKIPKAHAAMAIVQYDGFFADETFQAEQFTKALAALSKQAAVPTTVETPSPKPIRRTWADRDDRKFEGDLLDFDGKHARIRRVSDNKEYNLPLERFSDADRAFLKNHQSTTKTPSAKSSVPPSSKGQQQTVSTEEAAWSISEFSVQTTKRGDDISDGYKESKGIATVNLKPAEGHRFVIAQCRLTARSSQRNAVELLSNRRIQLEKEKHRVWQVSDDDRKRLTGEYRMFDLQSVALLDTDGKLHKATWIVDGPGRFTLISPSGIISGEGETPAPWHACYLTDRTFTGLLEKGRDANVAFLVGVPNNADLAMLSLQVLPSK